MPQPQTLEAKSLEKAAKLLLIPLETKGDVIGAQDLRPSSNWCRRRVSDPEKQLVFPAALAAAPFRREESWLYYIISNIASSFKILSFKNG